MRKSLHIKFDRLFEPIPQARLLKNGLPMYTAEQSYWQSQAGELTLQEFDGRHGYLYSCEASLSQPIRLSLVVDPADAHLLYLLNGEQAFALYSQQGQLLSSLAPNCARYIYLPKGQYQLELQSGPSLLFGFYFDIGNFRQGNERSFPFIKHLISAVRQQSAKPAYSTEFELDMRSHNHIRKLCKGLHKGKLGNESFILAQLVKLIEISEESISQQNRPPQPNQQQKVEQVRQLIAHYIDEETGSFTIRELAKQLHTDRSELNKAHQKMYGESLLSLKNSLLLRKAKALLLDQHTASQVSYRLDYSSPSTFARFFKKQTGTSVSQWLKQQQNRNTQSG